MFFYKVIRYVKENDKYKMIYDFRLDKNIYFLIVGLKY